MTDITDELMRILKFIGLVGCLMASLVLDAQVGMGKWRMHINPNRAIGVVKAHNVIYSALEGGVLEYDLSAGEKYVWTAANFLSDSKVTAIAHEPKNDVVCIGYANGNLDLLLKNRIFNLPAILQASISGVKRVNNITPHKGMAYVATGFGIVVINTERLEVRDTYYPTAGNTPIIEVAFANDSIYALTQNRIFVASASNNFLADPSQWRVASYIPDYSATGKYNAITTYNGDLFLSYDDQIYNSDTVFRIKNGVLSVVADEMESLNLGVTNNQLLICTDGALRVYNQSLEEDRRIFQYDNGVFPSPRGAAYHDGYYFIADNRTGLVKARNSFSSQHITFEGPSNSGAFRGRWESGKLALVGGGITPSNGPTFSRSGGFTLQEEKWSSFNFDSDPLIKAVDMRDFISTAVNPRNPSQVAFGTYSDVPVLFSDNGVEITDTFGFYNSLLEPTSFTNLRGMITDMVFDAQENLWVLNGFTNRPLKVRDRDGIWHDFSLGFNVSNNRTQRIAIANNGVKWFSLDGLGVVAYDDGGTLSDPADDRVRLLNNGENSGALPTNTIEALAIDHNNHVWVGTTEGMRVLYNTFNVFEANAGDYNFQRLLIEFGENVEIVLGTTHITSIEVDGANRKWIGTANAGVFLFSPDGLTLLESFTAENSPLLSNNILDIAINHQNGEVFFITTEGMISYRSDASRGDDNYTNVKVFPNPVYPDYFGPITIQGIAANSDVRITDISGKLVYQTVSNGGTATWNGMTLDGQRVTTGVYLIWTTIDDVDRKGRKVGKVVFIN